MKRLIYNDKKFKILNEYSLNFSSNEVTFNDITIDFSKNTLSDIPYKFQKVEIRESENKDFTKSTLLFTGYVDSVKPRKNENETRKKRT